MNLRPFNQSLKLLNLCDLLLACGLYGICSSQSTCRYLQPGTITEKIYDRFEMGIYNGSCEILGAG
jgi:hypothetical protein